MTYRNPKLLRLARLVPHCMWCRRQNYGDVVAAHANTDKGMGIKAPDHQWAALCGRCHHEIDQGKDLTREERRLFWLEAFRRTIGWLFEAGHLVVTEPGDDTWRDPLTSPPDASTAPARPKKPLPKRRQPIPTRKLESGKREWPSRPLRW